MQRWIWVLWPAFLLACALEMLVFALFDPSDMSWRGESLGLSRQTVLSGAFFLFWLLAAVSNLLLLLLVRPGREINKRPELSRPAD